MASNPLALTDIICSGRVFISLIFFFFLHALNEDINLIGSEKSPAWGGEMI